MLLPLIVHSLIVVTTHHRIGFFFLSNFKIKVLIVNGYIEINWKNKEIEIIVFKLYAILAVSIKKTN